MPCTACLQDMAAHYADPLPLLEEVTERSLTLDQLAVRMRMVRYRVLARTERCAHAHAWWGGLGLG